VTIDENDRKRRNNKNNDAVSSLVVPLFGLLFGSARLWDNFAMEYIARRINLKQTVAIDEKDSERKKQ
jgi:5-methylcytosine-specific restriction endonuclease McrBC regulatory subunit McrC